MYCFVCGEKIDSTGLNSYKFCGLDLFHHFACDPEVAVAKTVKIVVRPFNIRKYKNAAPSGTSYSKEIIDNNKIGEI